MMLVFALSIGQSGGEVAAGHDANYDRAGHAIGRDGNRPDSVLHHPRSHHGFLASPVASRSPPYLDVGAAAAAP